MLILLRPVFVQNVDTQMQMKAQSYCKTLQRSCQNDPIPAV